MGIKVTGKRLGSITKKRADFRKTKAKKTPKKTTKKRK